MNYFLGFDIGGTKCSVVLGNDHGSLLEHRSFATDHNSGPDAVIRQLCETASGLSSALQSSRGQKPVAIGMSCGGPLDSRSGIIYSPPNLPGWDAVPIVKIVGSELGVPTALQNDANACALAEWRYGAGRGYRNMVFLTFGTGMGAGLILDGRLYTGTNDMAGEIGHVRMEDSGPLGYGKKGSFEGFCSGAGIARLARSRVQTEWAQGRRVAFCANEAQLEALTTREVGEAALAGDPTAVEIIETSAEYLGRGLAIIVDLLNPECIVLGSIFVRLEALLRPRMEAVLQSECLEQAGRVCRILPAALGEEVGLMAALSVAEKAYMEAGNE
ncbi:MAG: ROK family protein [Spirochaetaceae bacterium]|nr:MAG: ROK family protein [Spirochaetaceae bacterium]